MGQVGVHFQIQLACEAVELGAPWRQAAAEYAEARRRTAASNPAKCANPHLIFCRALNQSCSG